MKPVDFDYVAPQTLGEAVGLLAGGGDDARALAGGQSLVPLLNLRLVRPRLVVDLNRVAGLDGIREDGAGLTLGAMTRQADAERSTLVRTRAPLLAEALALVGHLAIRFRGTIGGTVAHADPVAEVPAAALALDATLDVTGPRGRRTIAIDDFLRGPLMTDLAPGELLTAVRLPPWSPAWGWAFVEFARRHGDFALAGVAVVLAVVDGRIAEPTRIVVIGDAARCRRARAAERRLVGERPEPKTFAAAAAVADEGLDPPGDIHGSAAYRAHLVRTLTGRALEIAATRGARG
ncbi:MAG: FAD binding domain-containing protein [Candidatus Rokubacteria bacterium]|nr:FAD binding domain-containing protein [Candidatus Rokubacteria bacterium]